MLLCLDQRTGTGCGTENSDGAPTCAGCGRSLRFALSLHNPGTTVGQYRIMRVLGYGGFGAVYEAALLSDPTTHVALKETFAPASIASFQKEFAILQGLQHPNLPHYRTTFATPSHGYLVMEFVPGQNLEQIVQRQGGPLSEPQVLGYAVQLCDVLTYLHGLPTPVLHRDIKPANIRITPDGLIKLVDFGLLKHGIGPTRTSRMGLTPAYAPIEQYSGNGLTDPRSDIYSLGATLYHLLTGQEPLSATDRIAAAHDPLPDPQQINPRLSRQVTDALIGAMGLTQQGRFASAQALKQALLGTGGLPAVIGAPTIALGIPLTCQRCQATNAVDEIYCQTCAQPLQGSQPCRSCRRAVPANARFCPRCGRAA